MPAGTLYGFLGPNGAGKTTTIRVLLGLLKANHGHAAVLGRDCWREAKAIKADVGYLAGDLRLYPRLNLDSALRIFGAIRGRDLCAAGRALAERFALDPTLAVSRMSRGNRQKVGLILALAHAPRLLILDEPTTALDPIMQERLYECLHEQVAGGTTVFFSSHTLSEVERLCDRVAILRAGRLVADEPLTALRARARREVLIRWKNGRRDDAQLPGFLSLTECRGREWHATLTGPIDELLAWIGGQEVEDLEIGKPDLEALFRRFYLDPSPESPAASTAQSPGQYSL